MTTPGHRPRADASGPTEDEIAAVLAALVGREVGPAPGGYERWRRTRLAVRAITGRDGDTRHVGDARPRR